MKAKRLEKVSRMIRLLAGARVLKVLFTDEKVFTVEPSHNRQTSTTKEGSAEDRNSKSQWSKPFSGFCDGPSRPKEKMLLVFINRIVKINAASDQQPVLRYVLKPWATSHFGANGFTLQ